MKITIHRAHQIGGCITIIEHDGCKVILDLGSNLPGTEEHDYTKEEVAALTQGANAIFYSHYHGDHIGMHHLVDPAIPQFIGRGAKQVVRCKYEALSHHSDYTAELAAIEAMRCYEVGRPAQFDGCDKIKVTPYLVSHSAFDAYMFLVEFDRVKVLYTGDFRQHGFLGMGLFSTLEEYVGQVDILITEGTMLGRRQERVLSERDIEQNVVRAIREHKYVFVLCSSTDIDRLASLHAASKLARRPFVVDEYQQQVLNIFSIYAGSKSDLFIFNNTFRLINYKTAKVVRKLKGQGFIMPIRSGMEDLVRAMMEVYDDEDPWLIYSMWGGYAEEGKPYTNDKIRSLRSLFGERILDGTRDGFHTSGHADANALAAVCSCVSPRLGVIPIHMDADARYDMAEVQDYRIITASAQLSEKVEVKIV